MARNSLGCAGGQAEQSRSTWFVVNQDGTAGINPGGFI
jgi:hypothetical protein